MKRLLLLAYAHNAKPNPCKGGYPDGAVYRASVNTVAINGVQIGQTEGQARVIVEPPERRSWRRNYSSAGWMACR